MASPHAVRFAKLGFASITRTVANLNIDPVQAIVFDDTGQYPLNAIQPPVSGGIFSKISFTTLLNPSGSTDGAKTPADAALLKACGWAETLVGGGPPATGTTSATYTASGNPSVATGPCTANAVDIVTSIGQDAVANLNLLQTCTNAFGTVNFRFVAGQPVMCDWAFDGIMTVPTEGVSLAGTLTNKGAAPACIGTSTVIDGDTLVFRELTINSNAMNDSPNLNIGSSAGVADPSFSGMMPTVSILVTLPALGTANYYTNLQAGTLSTLSCVIGVGAGFVITVAGKAYLTDAPRLTDIGGILRARLNYRMDWASGSPITIAFT